jgi:hypothetical protein
MIGNKRVVTSSYIRSLDRRIMVQIEPGCFVSLRSARRLRMICKPGRGPRRRCMTDRECLSQGFSLSPHILRALLLSKRRMNNYHRRPPVACAVDGDGRSLWRWFLAARRQG